MLLTLSRCAGIVWLHLLAVLKRAESHAMYGVFVMFRKATSLILDQYLLYAFLSLLLFLILRRVGCMFILQPTLTRAALQLFPLFLGGLIEALLNEG